MTTAMTTGGARAVERCDLLGQPPYSDSMQGLYRGYLTPAYFAAQERLAQWMNEAGMGVHRDAAHNLIGRYEGLEPQAPALLIGSHLDSVRNAGRYDGPLGIMLGVEAVSKLRDRGCRLPFAVEVIAFGDEEGSRFPVAMLTSRAVAGTLSVADLQVVDAEGIGLAEAGVDVGRFASAARPAPSILAYLEAHIEQGPVLESENLPVGSVTGVAAQLRARVLVKGNAGHAGTYPMGLRHDALAGAAAMVLAVEQIAQSEAGAVVATVGRLSVSPNTANTIAGKVEFSLDVRSAEPDRRDRAAQAIHAQIARIAAARGLDVQVHIIHDLAPSKSDVKLLDLLDAAIADAGCEPRRLSSGAGHDAMIMAALCPTVMLFIRCAGGVSHHPAESVSAADADVALNAIGHFIRRLAHSLE